MESPETKKRSRQRKQPETAGQLIIVGGGAAGMMAAVCAARAGASVTILERNARLGKKLAQTGSGRCNFTNTDFREECFRSANASFPWQLLRRFSPEDSIRFFRELGIYPRYRGSYVYPHSDQASSLVNALRQALSQLSVRVICDCLVERIQREGRGFRLRSSQGGFRGDAVLLAAGSRAFPVTGSDGSGYTLARQLGHSLIPVVPSLVGLRCAGRQYKEMAGVRTDALLTLRIDREEAYRERGELQLTDYGISGIPVFQFSRLAAYGLLEQKKVSVTINFLPELSGEALLLYLRERKEMLFYRTADSFLEGLLNQKLASVLLKRSGVPLSEAVSALREETLRRLAEEISAYSAEVIAANPFENAQCAAGGVDTSELDAETLESRINPRLYFAGELLDVDGICGGYNLQFAWASGAVAGRAAAAALRCRTGEVRQKKPDSQML